MVPDTLRLALDAWRVTGRTQHYRLHVQGGKVQLN